MDELAAAVRGQYRVSIDYAPVKPERGARGVRSIEPHAVGYANKSGAPLVRAWVEEGVSYSHGERLRRGRAPLDGRWRLFNVNHIRSLRPLRTQRFQPRPGYSYGDRAMRKRTLVAIPRRGTRRR
jgi:hypothetical protein